MSRRLLQFFTYDHLKSDLQMVSRSFCDLAVLVDHTLPDNPERDEARPMTEEEWIRERGATVIDGEATDTTPPTLEDKLNVVHDVVRE